MSPSLPANKRPKGTGIRVGARGWYTPVGTHPTVPCRDCGRRADADFGDHGGECVALA